jgi:hypothetical protein
VAGSSKRQDTGGKPEMQVRTLYPFASKGFTMSKEFLVITEKGGYMVGSTKSEEAASSWAEDYELYRGIKCLVVLRGPHDRVESVQEK